MKKLIFLLLLSNVTYAAEECTLRKFFWDIDLGRIPGSNDEIITQCMPYVKLESFVYADDSFGLQNKSPLVDLFDHFVSSTPITLERTKLKLELLRIFLELPDCNLLTDCHSHTSSKQIESTCLILSLSDFMDHKPLTEVEYNEIKINFICIINNFIIKHRSALSSEQLLVILAACLDYAPIVDSIRTITQERKSEFALTPLSEDEISTTLARFYNPGTTDGTGLHFLEGFPAAETWRLFIDGNKQISERGWLSYEAREPGCTHKMFNAWKEIISSAASCSIPISLDYIIRLHDLAAGHMWNHGKLNFGNGNSFSAVPGSNISLLGYFEHDPDISSISKSGCSYRANFSIGRSASLRDERAFFEKLTMIIADYELKTKLLRTPENIIRDIIKLCKSLEVIHPFSDGNCRTFCVLLFNKELLRHGFAPIIFNNPNMVDARSEDEIFHQVLLGMQNFDSVKRIGKLPGDCITTEEAIIASRSGTLHNPYMLYPIPELAAFTSLADDPLMLETAAKDRIELEASKEGC